MSTMETSSANANYDQIPIAPSILHSDFLLSSSPPLQSLRVCCYGSSSSQTPEQYLQEARHVGYILAKRGHVLVNGAGQFGCMAAMNDGCCKGNGHIVGVIHEMWLVDGEDGSSASSTWTNGKAVRDGGAHGAFANTSAAKPLGGHDQDGPIREMLIAGGKDLQERKRLLMEGADALLVLPGGPGTWDELWEAACARGIGLTNIPIVVVDVDGYYDPFLQIMERAYKEGLTKLKPDELIHFEQSAEGAIQWIESIHNQQGTRADPVLLPPRESRAVVRKSSIMTIPPLGSDDSWFFGSLRRSLSQLSGSNKIDSKANVDKQGDAAVKSSLVFALGILAGVIGCGLFSKHKGS
jgi:uncharacterized protein (TIGR00730 family)